VKRLLVTRSAERTAPLREALSARDVEAVSLPVTRTVWLDTPPPDLEGTRWVLFTSMRSVLGMQRRRGEWSGRLPGEARAAALASSTAEAVREKLDIPLELAAGRSGAELGAALLQKETDLGRLLWPCAETTAGGLCDALEQHCRELVRWPLYRTEKRNPAEIREELERQAPFDALLFAAPSAVKAWQAAAEAPFTLPCVAIGPTTADALQRAGAGRVVTAESPDTEGMARAALKALEMTD
jgi:uroporphyrinogen-III synthase